MVMLAEHYEFIIGGDPDRDTIDLAILDAVTGRVHTQYSDAADSRRSGLPSDAGLGRALRTGPPRLGVGGNRQLRRRLGHRPSRGG
ncbi:MAG: hypothetical protein K0R13_3610 [Propionibacteriaceae bacterium]|nr:hypothetical protein [Propionibacteriaceae bacterium]